MCSPPGVKKGLCSSSWVEEDLCSLPGATEGLHSSSGVLLAVLLVKLVWGEEVAAPLLRSHEVSLCSSDGLGHSPDGLYARPVVEDESIADHC